MQKITHTIAIEYIGQLGDKYRIHATPKEAAGEFWKNGMNLVRHCNTINESNSFIGRVFGHRGIKVIEV